MTAIIPWPITYETLSSKFAKNRLSLQGFEKQLKSPRVQFVDDGPYREDALKHALDSSLRRRRPLSLTDCLLRVVVKVRTFPAKTANELDPMRYSGTVSWPVDGLAYQERLRGEWE